MKLLRAIWLALTLRCDEAGRIEVASRAGDATRGERVALKLHRGICGACRTAKKQLERLDEQLATLREGDDREVMPPDARARMMAILSETPDGSD